jgi:hypothetical protein
MRIERERDLHTTDLCHASLRAAQGLDPTAFHIPNAPHIKGLYGQDVWLLQAGCSQGRGPEGLLQGRCMASDRMAAAYINGLQDRAMDRSANG